MSDIIEEEGDEDQKVIIACDNWQLLAPLIEDGVLKTKEFRYPNL